jgi:ABC-type nitrate/sulfonate/bicarbonate transport system permease component
MYRLIPISLVLLILVIWQLVIQIGDVPVYLMPSPDRIFITLVTDSSS